MKSARHTWQMKRFRRSAETRSSFILSLFAFWLDPQGQPIIYYDSLRKGLFTFVKSGMLCCLVEHVEAL